MKRHWLLMISLAAELCVGFQPRAPTITPSSASFAGTELPETDELPSMDPISHDLDIPQLVEAEIRDDINISSSIPLAPPVTFNKFLTMQDKRVVVTIGYADGCGLKPFYLTAAKKIKASHPDVVIEKRVLPGLPDGEVAFEILVDGKVVVGNQRANRKQRAFGALASDGSVFVSMQELDLAISKARRKRRPTTLYGEDPSNVGMRLEMLRKSRAEEAETGNIGGTKWND